MHHLDELKPASEVDKTTALDKGESGAVAAEGLPDLGVQLAKSVAMEVGAEDEMLIERLKTRLD